MPIRLQSLNRQLQSIEHLISISKDLSIDEIEIQGHWGRYLCVLSAGFIENSLQELYSNYCSARAERKVSMFLNSRLKRITNPKAGRFVEIARQFNKGWAKELENFLDADESRRAGINSIMRNRHQIVHGESSTISVNQVQSYLKKSVEVIEFIEKQLSQ